MRGLFSWSVPLGHVFGITVKVHWMFPLVALGLILRWAMKSGLPEGAWVDGVWLMGLLFLSVLLHEFGHCLAARWVDGDADEILMWPLGGLANVDIPREPRAHFLTAAAGPAVNLLLAGLCTFLLAFAADSSYAFKPLWNPLANIFRIDGTGAIRLWTWDGQEVSVNHVWPIFLARMFWVNWILFWLNVLLACFPMDGGRMLQSALWPSLGERQALLFVVYSGFVYMAVIALIGIVYNEFLIGCLAFFIGYSCYVQLFILETGGEEGLFGYDFSQGYTSLEREAPRLTTKRTSWWKRWRDSRAARKLQREMEAREAEERRLDELLEKVQKFGMNALTEEERRFMKRVSDRYRNRN